MTPGTIWESATAQTITFEQLIDRLAQVRVVYVGEQHPNSHHHEVQRRILESLTLRKEDLLVGMEMFDRTYQNKLDRWSRGELEWSAFLKQVHWYANWKFDADLYKPILMMVQTQKLPLVGLNLPFHIAPKIAQGGIDSLSEADRAHLPTFLDTDNAAHRAYLEEVFKLHRFAGQNDFETFYQAQCAWEETMAQSIADHLGNASMVVLAGNGHIVRHFGIPQRAFRRTAAAFRTVYLATPEMTVSPEDGDFIWSTASTANPHH